MEEEFFPQTCGVRKGFPGGSITLSPGRRAGSKARGVGASAREGAGSMTNGKDMSDDLVWAVPARGTQSGVPGPAAPASRAGVRSEPFHPYPRLPESEALKPVPMTCVGKFFWDSDALLSGGTSAAASHSPCCSPWGHHAAEPEGLCDMCLPSTPLCTKGPAPW